MSLDFSIKYMHDKIINNKQCCKTIIIFANKIILRKSMINNDINKKGGKQGYA